MGKTVKSALCTSVMLAGVWAFPAVTAEISLSPGAVFQDCTDCPELVVIPAGSNIMGSTKEETDREGVPVIAKMDIAWVDCIMNTSG